MALRDRVNSDGSVLIAHSASIHSSDRALEGLVPITNGVALLSSNVTDLEQRLVTLSSQVESVAGMQARHTVLIHGLQNSFT